MMEFTVTLSAIPAEPVSVDYTTWDGSATAGSDYQTTTGTLTWNAGNNTPQTIQIPVSGDAVFEPVDGQFSAPIPISIIGVDGVQNSLTLDSVSASEVLNGGIYFQGGQSSGDSLVIDDSVAQTVQHTITGDGSGTFTVDGADNCTPGPSRLPTGSHPP